MRIGDRSVQLAHLLAGLRVQAVDLGDVPDVAVQLLSQTPRLVGGVAPPGQPLVQLSQDGAIAQDLALAGGDTGLQLSRDREVYSVDVGANVLS